MQKNKDGREGEDPWDSDLFSAVSSFTVPGTLQPYINNVASDGSRDAAAEDRGGLCCLFPPGLGQAAAGAWGLVLLRERLVPALAACLQPGFCV